MKQSKARVRNHVRCAIGTRTDRASAIRAPRSGWPARSRRMAPKVLATRPAVAWRVADSQDAATLHDDRLAAKAVARIR